MRTRSTLRLLATFSVLALFVAACVSGDDSSDAFETVSDQYAGDGGAPATTIAADRDTGGGGDGVEAPADEDVLGAGGIEPVVLQSDDLGRDIIYTADLTVAVTDVGEAGTEATRAIESLGGFLFGQQTTGSPEPRSVLTFKVSPEDFQEALARLGSIGELRSQRVTADDVTERIVDLESRIVTAEASVERLRAFLESATTVDQIAELERELLDRETELETLRGRLRTLQDQVALATIVLTITEAASRPAMNVSVTAYPGHDGGLSCPGDPNLRVETDTETTVCWEIVNVGDTWLEDFEVRDPVLDVDTADLVAVFGDPDARIEPGESIVLAAEVTMERTLRTRTTVTATPVDEDGAEVASRPEADTSTIQIQAVDPGGIPSFGEGLEESWELLVRLGQAAVLALAWLVPFLWLPLLLWFLWRRSRRSRATEPPPPVPETDR